jgi:hypothetical protein
MVFLYMILVVVLVGGFFVVLIRVVAKVMEKLGGETIYKLQQSAEFVSSAGLVPPFWRDKVERRLNRGRRKGGSQKRIIRLEAAARRRYIRQLRKLIHFVKNSSTIADEKDRDTLVVRLRGTMTSWKTMSWKDMTGS